MPAWKNNFIKLLQPILNIIAALLYPIVVLLLVIGDSIAFFFISIWNFIRFLSSKVVSIARLITKGPKKGSIIKFSDIRGSLIAKFRAQKKKRGRPVKNVTLLKIKKERSLQQRLQYFLLGLGVALIAILVQEGYAFVNDLPDPKLIGNINYPVSTQIYDRNGKLLYDVYKDQNRTPVDVDALPDYVVQATIAIEDKSFYSHNGISLFGGVLRALKDMAISGKLQGGSTITQQLVKTSLLTPERTFERKIKEAILALWTEQIYTKNEILEMYLNQVPYGGSSYGIEEASKTFFSKPAQELTVEEAALLAGLPQAPSAYSPYLNPRGAIQRRNEVLLSMSKQGYLSEESYQELIKKPLEIVPPKVFIRAPHFVFYVKALLEEQFGIRRVEEGGLRVVTSLDIDLQEEVEDIVNEELEKVKHLNVGNGGVLVTAPSTGEILAMVGSKDYFEQPYGAFNVTTALRQPGSSIKPLLYSLALSKQFTPASIINDAPVVFNIPGSKPYRPVNYDGRFHGPVPLRYALANSYNIPAVKTLNELGVKDFIDHGTNMGISTWNTPERYGLSLALGGAEVHMTDMAVAYGVFANYGSRVPLNPILSVKDYRGKELDVTLIGSPRDVLTPQVSFLISDILSDNFARQFAFGLQSDLFIEDRKVAVKTGTTNSKRDNWTLGYNRKYLTAVWVGNNDNTPMNQSLTSGITGASPIWNRVMTSVLDRNIRLNVAIQPPDEFTIPEGIVSRNCYFGRIEYFIAGSENKDRCGSGIFNTTPTEVPVQ